MKKIGAAILAIALIVAGLCLLPKVTVPKAQKAEETNTTNDMVVHVNGISLR